MVPNGLYVCGVSFTGKISCTRLPLSLSLSLSLSLLICRTNFSLVHIFACACFIISLLLNASMVVTLADSIFSEFAG